jgi:hypothetical protein
MKKLSLNLPNFNSEIEPPAALLSQVMSRISREQKISAIRRRLIGFGAILCSALLACYPAINYLRGELIQSGFGRYLIIFFYDFKMIAVYWQDFGLTLLESLPATGLALTLLVFLLIMVSLRSVVKNISLLSQITHKQIYQ